MHRETIERLDLIVRTLFPTFDATQVAAHPETKPLHHPERPRWTNGATLKAATHMPDGSLLVRVESHLDGDRYDPFEFSVPAAWMTCDNLQEQVNGWLQQICTKAKIAELEREATGIEHKLNTGRAGKAGLAHIEAIRNEIAALKNPQQSMGSDESDPIESPKP